MATYTQPKITEEQMKQLEAQKLALFGEGNSVIRLRGFLKVWDTRTSQSGTQYRDVQIRVPYEDLETGRPLYATIVWKLWEEDTEIIGDELIRIFTNTKKKVTVEFSSNDMTPNAYTSRKNGEEVLSWVVRDMSIYADLISIIKSQPKQEEEETVNEGVDPSVIDDEHPF